MWHFIIRLVVFGDSKDISANRMLGTTLPVSVTSQRLIVVSNAAVRSSNFA
jgi:hypothetical protein